MRKFFLITLFFSFFTPFLSSRHSTAPLWKDKQVKIDALMTIGNESFDDERYAFGSIRNMTVSKAGSIIVIDQRTHRILKFSKEGRFLCYIGKGKGDGPGEFREPLAVATDDEENIYIADHGKFKLLVFSPTGDYIRSFGIEKKMPFSLAVGLDQCIFMAYWRADRDGNYVYQYSKDGKIMATFCQADDKEQAALSQDSGNPGTLCLSPPGILVYGFHYPYSIRIFSPTGKVLQEFTRNTDSMRPPAENKKHNYIYSRGGGRGVACLPDGTIVSACFSNINTDEDDPDYYFDLFSPEGTWLISVPTSAFRAKRIFSFAIDREGYFYITFNEPYYHIKKFRVRFI